MNSLYISENFITNNGWGTLAHSKVMEDSKNYKHLYLASNNFILNQALPDNSEFIAKLPPPNNKIRCILQVFISYIQILKILLLKGFDDINILSEPYYYLSLLLPRNTVNFYLIGTHCLGPKSSIGKFFYRLSLSRCKSVRYISEYTLLKFKSQHSLSIKYTPYKPKLPILFLEYRKKIDRKYLLIVVGEIKPRKGHDIIIDALNILKSDLKNFKCAFIGAYDSEYGDQIKNKIIEYKLENNILLTNRIDDRSLVNSYFQDSICSAIISTERDGHFEGFGVVHIESNMLYSWPIGVRDSGNAAAIADSINGTLLQTSDPILMATELLEIYQMDEDHFFKKVSLAREFALENYGRNL